MFANVVPGDSSSQKSTVPFDWEELHSRGHKTVVETEEVPYNAEGLALVFYLTRDLTPAQDEKIRQQLEERMPGFAKCFRYYSWKERNHDTDGTLEDVARIAYGTSMLDEPHTSHCIVFIDKKSTEDDTILIVEIQGSYSEEYPRKEDEGELPAGSINTRGRMAAIHAYSAVVNSQLGNMDLIEYFESGSPEDWKGELHFDRYQSAERQDQKAPLDVEED